VEPDTDGQCQCDADKWISKDQTQCIDCDKVIENCLTCDNGEQRSTICS
jgi:hypothetical protein